MAQKCKNPSCLPGTLAHEFVQVIPPPENDPLPPFTLGTLVEAIERKGKMAV
jgi:hypothetical protein